MCLVRRDLLLGGPVTDLNRVMRVGEVDDDVLVTAESDLFTAK
jgi:hypothetical protein